MNKALLSFIAALLFCTVCATKYSIVESNRSYTHPTKGFVTSSPYGFCWRSVQDNYFMQHRWAPENIVVNNAQQAVKNPIDDIHTLDFLSKDVVGLISKQEPLSIYFVDKLSDKVNRTEPVVLDDIPLKAIESLCLFNHNITLNGVSIVSTTQQPASFVLAWHKQVSTYNTTQQSDKVWRLLQATLLNQTSVERHLKTPVLYWSNYVQRLFVGMSLQSKADATDYQAMSNVNVVCLHEDTMSLQSFCNKALLEENDPFYVQGADKCLYVHHLGEFVAPSHHLFLIMVGGQGTAQQTAKQVWCVPITTAYPHNKRSKQIKPLDNSLLGTLAVPLGQSVLNQHLSAGKIKDTYKCYHPSLIKSDTPCVDQAALKVGGTTSLPGPVGFLYTHENIVAVSLEHQEDTNTPGGIFYSCPLYNKNGHIKGWTNWQRLFGVAEPTLCFDIDLNTAQVTYIACEDNQLTLKKSEWLTAQAPYEPAVVGQCLSKVMNHCAFHATQPIQYAQDQDSLLIIAPYAASFVKKNEDHNFEYIYYTPNDLQAIGALECGAINDLENTTIMLGATQGICYQTIGRDILRYDTTLHNVRHISPCPNGFVVCAQEGYYRYYFDADGSITKELFTVPKDCGAVLKIVTWYNTFLLCTTKGLYSMYQKDDEWSDWYKINLYQQNHCAVIDCYSMPTSSQTINNFYIVTQQGVTTALHKIVVKHTNQGHTIDCLPLYQAYAAQALKQPHLSALQARTMIMTDGIGVWYAVGEYNTPAHKLAYVSWATKELCWQTSLYGVPMIQKKEYTLNAFFYSNLLQTWLGFGDFGLLIAH